MRIFFIRHAESESNVGNRSHLPELIKLTPTGIEQANTLLNEIPSAPDLIILSPYLRTFQTAQAVVNNYPQVPVETWPIHEFTFLSPKLCLDTTPKERLPRVGEYWQKCDPDFIHGDGAESFNQFCYRIYSILQRLVVTENAFTIVFTHAHVTRVIMQIINKRQSPPNISMKFYRDEMLKYSIPNINIFETNTETLRDSVAI